MSLRLRLFRSYALLVILFLFIVAGVVALLLRGLVDNSALSGLDNMTRPISVELIALIRGNVTLQQVAASLQEQADKNGAYIILTDSSGNIVRQLVPLQPQALQPIQVAPGVFPQDVTSALKGKITDADGKTYLYAAYPINRQNSQFISVNTLLLVIPRPGILAVLKTIILPFLVAAGLALVCSLLAAILMARAIYRPLAKVTTAAEQMANGDYSQRIKPEGPKEIKALAESFNRMTENVEQAQLRLRHFVADVSHELRSPLTSIQGFAQALLDGTAADDATKLKAAQIIDEESRRLRHQVDELLELSRMQSNQIIFRKERVNISETLERCTEILAVQAKQKQVTIELKAEPALTVTGDNDTLEQVFINLLDNAIKNSPAGGKVSITSGQSEGKFAKVTVADEGPGIHPDHLAHVFERFYQVPGARTGVGLGLTIAKEIVIGHQGTITVESSPGEGARFTVTLPLTKEK
jgi:signal transduction histidine kinase